MSEKSGKLIAVWGAPHSGKTTFSASLATAIADSYASATVIVLHSDIEAPMLSVLFPNAKSGSLGSVGIPLSANELDTEQILANCTETKARSTLAVMGYRDGDTRLTYPRYGKERATELLQRLLSLADFVIVDCMSNPNESL
ncbi:MAG: ParA family protein, partial [Eubacteriales bacterium]|nr:ParA family protein [Eubacteriales bacterium]